MLRETVRSAVAEMMAHVETPATDQEYAERHRDDFRSHRPGFAKPLVTSSCAGLMLIRSADVFGRPTDSMFSSCCFSRDLGAILRAADRLAWASSRSWRRASRSDTAFST